MFGIICTPPQTSKFRSEISFVGKKLLNTDTVYGVDIGQYRILFLLRFCNIQTSRNLSPLSSFYIYCHILFIFYCWFFNIYLLVAVSFPLSSVTLFTYTLYFSWSFLSEFYNFINIFKKIIFYFFSIMFSIYCF